MALFLAGTKVRPIDQRHLWRVTERECVVEGTYLSRRVHQETQERRVVLALRVEGFAFPVYQWAADFEAVEADAEKNDRPLGRLAPTPE